MLVRKLDPCRTPLIKCPSGFSISGWLFFVIYYFHPDCCCDAQAHACGAMYSQPAVRQPVPTGFLRVLEAGLPSQARVVNVYGVGVSSWRTEWHTDMYALWKLPTG